MDWESLDEMIDEFRRSMPPAPSALGIFIERHDWRPVWQQAREIQEAFRSIRYPTRELRQAAWTRFSEFRMEASRRADSERDWLRLRSEQHRNDILYECKGLDYSKLTDLLFFFDPTTVEDMKQAGRKLGHAMRMLKERKHEMLPEHKQQCFDRFQEIKESHENFWADYREARDQRRHQHEEKRRAIIAKVEANLDKNRDELRRAKAALERTQERISELRDKISGTNSEKWQNIWGEWLEEAERKADDIEQHIDRIRGWISENEGRLVDLSS